MREGGGILEGQPCRHRQERLLLRADVLGECPLPEREQIREDAVARPEARHARPDRLDLTGDIDPHPRIPRARAHR